MPKATKKFDHNFCGDAILNMEYEQDAKPMTVDGQNGHKISPNRANRGNADWVEKCSEFPEDLSSMFDKIKSTAVIKKKNADLATENTVKIWQKNFSNTMKKHAGKRKNNNEAMLRDLNVLASKLETDNKSLEENYQRINEWHSAHTKMAQQTPVAKRQKIQLLKKIHAEFMKEVEGLITRGAMKPDDRPIWFDVYRAFPPTVEPKFARPKPVQEPIRPIFYPEDQIRAKFHSKGHGLFVNMISPSNDTQIKRLVQNYEQLKSEGQSEEQLLEQCVATVESDRKLSSPRMRLTDPNSVTSQVFAEADIKNIFKE